MDPRHHDAQTRALYDEIPYPGHPFVQAHINRLATIGHLHGLKPASPDAAQVLELGCGDGGHLIPMAFERPGSRFVGIDLSPKQIELGQKTIRALGLTNIELRAGSILDVDESYGKFDYIIAHGVYSWVPPAVQDKILWISRNCLSPDGLAFISYNVYPGWHMLQIFRDMMRWHVRGIGPLEERAEAAIELFNLVAQAVPEDHEPFNTLIDWMKKVLTSRPISVAYFVHEYLEEVNAPCYFHEMVARANAQGLAFVGETAPGTLKLVDDEEVRDAVEELGTDPISRGQYLDFLSNRTFRQSVFCPIERQPHARPVAVGLSRLSISSAAQPESELEDLTTDEPVAFTAKTRGTIRTRVPLVKAALVELYEQWPRPITFDELVDAACERLKLTESPNQTELVELAEGLMTAFRASIAELHAVEPKFAVELGDRPQVSPLARFQAEIGRRALTTLRHQEFNLDDEVMQRLVIALDGQRTLDEVLEDLADHGGWSIRRHGEPLGSPEERRALLVGHLREMAEKICRSSLIWKP